MFNILEKLIEELEFAYLNQLKVNQKDIDWILDIRKQVFTQDANLTFDVVSRG